MSEHPRMLHIVTVHFRSPQWIEIQTRHLRENIAVPYETWTSLEGIDASYGSYFDHVLEQRGSHAAKLNHLAMEVSHVADDDDLLMFLDGDAFPIADPMPLIEDALERAPLLAVRRAENADEPQPHPCFCVTTVGIWRSLPGDWTAGRTWTGPHGNPTSDVGGNLLRKLELTDTPWVQVLRSNASDIDPLYFALYGPIYHHGAGFRTGELSPAHRAAAPRPLPVPRNPLARAARNLVNGLRWRAWERATQRRHIRQSQQMFERIKRGGSDWLEELRR
ncbi:MAG TPA: hypothetical protein VK756_10090 [Solirubrobacteraceae bacterium]|jgi:hypothetical protein|nr:hypothetical protein [Solirubrobacteraceae bacterium]